LRVFGGRLRTQEEAKKQKKDATWLRLEVRRCKDARGSEEIFNLAHHSLRRPLADTKKQAQHCA